MTISSQTFGQQTISVVLNEGQMPAKLSTDSNGNTVLVGADGLNFPAKKHRYFQRGGEKIFNSSPSSMTAYTMVGQFPAWGDFDAVRVVYANPSTNSGANATFDTTKIAVAPTAGNGGNTLTWASATFSGAASITLSAGSGSSSNFVPSFVKSDVIAMSNIARSDGGTYPLLQVRSYAAGLLNCFGESDAKVTNFATLHGREYRYGRGSGVVADNAALNPTGTGFNSPVHVEFFYRKPVFSFACIGDSIMYGSDGTNPVGNAIERFAFAKNISQTTSIITCSNFANGGQASAASFLTAAQVVSVIKPDALVFCPYTVNDPLRTQAEIDGAWASALSLIELCLNANIIPILCTAAPQDSMVLADDNLRKAQNARIRALSRAIPVLDFDLVLSDGASPANYITGYSTDATHPNATGHAALAAYVDSTLSQFVY